MTGAHADLKTFSSLGCYGLSVITGIAVQHDPSPPIIQEFSPQFISEQLEAVMTDLGVDAVKIGDLRRSEEVIVIADLLTKFSIPKVVLKLSLFDERGAQRYSDQVLSTIKRRLLPKVLTLVVNLQEAKTLLQRSIDSREEMALAAEALLSLGSPTVLVTGGLFTPDKIEDVFVSKEGTRPLWLTSRLVDTPNLKGAGTTFSAAFAALLARGIPLRLAAEKAKEFISGAISAGANRKLGTGPAPVQQFFWFWKE
jgi:hydroxymethylpyrimidine/phosphomethylpyrimidine kinase